MEKEVPAMKWAYGVTTIPARFATYLPQTLESLALAGFDKPRLFVDGLENPRDADQWSLQVTTRWPAIRAYGNWVLSIWELYIRNSQADRFAIFQDDLITYRNLKQYLSQCPLPSESFFNLYTVPDNEKLANGRTGWYQSNQYGRGALAFVFSRLGVATLLQQEAFVTKVETSNPHRNIDGRVIDSFKAVGWKEYVHNPSLVQHTGTLSSLRTGNALQPTTFKGEDFDATKLLCQGT